MAWQKLGRCFVPDRQRDFMHSHACVPTARYLPEEDRIRVYFAPRNERGQSLPTYLEVAATDPTQLHYLHDRPVLELGELGTFDDGGIMPCSVATDDAGRWYLYYVGWNPSVSVAYRNAVGLAISEDGGVTFQRPYPGAVVDRNLREPFFTASPCVLRRPGDGQWLMWYASSTGFLRVAGRTEPLYHVKFAHSADGINWERPNLSCLPPTYAGECTARPTVLLEHGRYRMWFCHRGSYDYRRGGGAYRIGYAESADGRVWDRNDAAAGLARTDAGWEAEMQTYPSVVNTPHGRYLFYNGNGFGATGIGCAIWQP